MQRTYKSQSCADVDSDTRHSRELPSLSHEVPKQLQLCVWLSPITQQAAGLAGEESRQNVCLEHQTRAKDRVIFCRYCFKSWHVWCMYMNQDGGLGTGLEGGLPRIFCSQLLPLRTGGDLAWASSCLLDLPTHLCPTAPIPHHFHINQTCRVSLLPSLSFHPYLLLSLSLSPPRHPPAVPHSPSAMGVRGDIAASREAG